MGHQIPACRVSNVSKSFGDQPVLRGLSFTVGGGERVALMGPSGSGKSTLLNCLSGIDSLDAGQIEIGGHKLTMDYPCAIKLSQMLKVHGKQAKKFAGDASKHFMTEAILTDAELNYKRGW